MNGGALDGRRMVIDANEKVIDLGGISVKELTGSANEATINSWSRGKII
jgi:hypothetical protein